MPSKATTGNDREVEQTRRFFKGLGGRIPDVYNSEPRDEAWARPMEVSVEQRFREAMNARVVPDLGVTDVECRTTTCRIVFEYRGTDPLPDDERTRRTRVNKLVGQLVQKTGALANSWTAIPPEDHDAGLRATYIIRFDEDAYAPEKYGEWVSNYNEKHKRFLAEREARQQAAPTTAAPPPATAP